MHVTSYKQSEYRDSIKSRRDKIGITRNNTIMNQWVTAQHIIALGALRWPLTVDEGILAEKCCIYV